MINNFSIFDSGKKSALENMAMDLQLLEGLEADNAKAILHLYDWEAPCLTYGYFTDPYQFLSKDGVELAGVQLARRPTGGGIIFHVTDFAFSIFIPATHPCYSTNTLDNYATINQMVVDVIKKFAEKQADIGLLAQDSPGIDSNATHFCMAKPTKYDVLLNGRKVGGAAQRRTKFGLLHQGSISLALPDQKFLKNILLPGTRIYEAMQLHTCPLLVESSSTSTIIEARLRLKDLFCQILQFLPKKI